MTNNDLGRWANIRLAFIKQHRSQLYQGLLKENKLQILANKANEIRGC